MEKKQGLWTRSHTADQWVCYLLSISSWKKNKNVLISANKDKIIILKANANYLVLEGHLFTEFLMLEHLHAEVLGFVHANRPVVFAMQIQMCNYCKLPEQMHGQEEQK